MPADDDLTAAVDRLCAHVSHWTPPRWAAFGASGERRGDLMYGLVQQLADLAADAEGQPRRPVPRLASDLALPDQLRVVAADLIAATGDRVAATSGQVTAGGRVAVVTGTEWHSEAARLVVAVRRAL